jgi:hypothetical protein
MAGLLGALGVSMGLVMLVLSIAVGAFFLWLSARIFDLRDKSFGTPMTIAAIVYVVSFILGFVPVLSYFSGAVLIVLEVWLIRSKYHVSLGKSLLVWLVTFVLSIVVMAVLAMLLFGSMIAGLGMYGVMH